MVLICKQGNCDHSCIFYGFSLAGKSIKLLVGASLPKSCDGIQGPRPAAIILGIIGLLLCTISVGKFISAAPANPLSIIGYIVGTIAMLVFLTQLFRWNLPIIGEPRTALIILAAAIIIKSVTARFGYLLTK